MAATRDLLSLTEARLAVNMPSGKTSHDGEIELFVTGISGRIDKLCGPVVQRTITGERHDGGKGRVLLDWQHVDSVSSVSEWSNTTETTLTEETDGTKPASGFLLHAVGPYAWLIRRSGNSDATFPAGRRNVVTTYVAGRYADTASVDGAFKLTAGSILRRIWKREQASWAQSPDFFADTESPAAGLSFFRAVDPMIKELLADELLPPVGL